MTRETYSVRCSHPECRYAALMLPTEAQAQAAARAHAARGHGVDVHRERRDRVAHVTAEERA